MQEPRCDINSLEKRFVSPIRLPALQPFDTLRPSRTHTPYLGSISLYDIGEDGRRSPEMVCAFRPDTYKPQHGAWLDGKLWVLGAEHIEVYDADLKTVREIRDPWLAGNHTIAANGRGELIVSASASDSVLTVNAETGEITGARRLPEDFYGFNYPLARQDSVVDHYIIDDDQLTHVNCAWPWRGGVLVSSLIQGAVGWFDPDGKYHELLSGFVGCHGARVRNDVEEIFFSDSCSGMLVFVDFQGRVVRRVGTGSRWLHDAIQIRGDLFAAAPFDHNEVILLDVTTRDVVSRIPCDARGAAQFLSFGVPLSEREPGDGRHAASGAPAGRPGWMTNGPGLIDAALHRQRVEMVHARDTLIAKHAEQIQTRDAIISDLRNERLLTLSAHEVAVAELDAARARDVGLRDRMLADLAAECRREMSARDAIIAQLHKAYADAVGTRDATLAALEATRSRDVEARDTTIAALHAERARELGRRDATISELNARQAEEVGRRDALLAELEAARARDVAIRDTTIAELHVEQAREMGRRDGAIAELSAQQAREVGLRDAMLADLEAMRLKDLAERDAVIASLREELAQAIKSRDAIAAELRLDLAFAKRGWRRWVIGQRR